MLCDSRNANHLRPNVPKKEKMCTVVVVVVGFVDDVRFGFPVSSRFFWFHMFWAIWCWRRRILSHSYGKTHFIYLYRKSLFIHCFWPHQFSYFIEHFSQTNIYLYFYHRRCIHCDLTKQINRNMVKNSYNNLVNLDASREPWMFCLGAQNPCNWLRPPVNYYRL